VAGTGWKKLYVYLGREKLVEYSAGVTWFFHADHLGTPKVRTTHLGTVAETWDTYPFGETWIAGLPGDQHRYTGHLRDAESNNDYAGARYYSNARGRWLSVDPSIGNLRNPQGLNRYSYVLNLPIDHVDPDGRQAQLVSDCYHFKDFNSEFWEVWRIQVCYSYEEPWIGPGFEPEPGSTAVGVATFTDLKRRQTKAALDGLPKNCADHLAKESGNSSIIEALKGTAGTLQFFDMTDKGNHNRLVREFVPEYPDDTTLLEYWNRGDPGARGAVLSVGEVMGVDVIDRIKPFELLGAGHTDNTLVHETLHVHFNLNDEDLRQVLGIFKNPEYSDSQLLSIFISASCPDTMLAPK